MPRFIRVSVSLFSNNWHLIESGTGGIINAPSESSVSFWKETLTVPTEGVLAQWGRVIKNELIQSTGFRESCISHLCGPAVQSSSSKQSTVVAALTFCSLSFSISFASLLPLSLAPSWRPSLREKLPISHRRSPITGSFVLLLPLLQFCIYSKRGPLASLLPLYFDCRRLPYFLVFFSINTIVKFHFIPAYVQIAAHSPPLYCMNFYSMYRALIMQPGRFSLSFSLY